MNPPAHLRPLIARGAWLLPAAMLAALPLRSDTGTYALHRVQGRLEDAPSMYRPVADYVVRDGLGGRLLAIITDPQLVVTGRLPEERGVLLRVTGRMPGQPPIPIGELAQLYPLNGLASATPLTGVLHGTWSGQSSSVLLGGVDPSPLVMAGPDVDTDLDGIPDGRDPLAADHSEWADTDLDGTGNNTDSDDDGDGIPDTFEDTHGLLSLENDGGLDPDQDQATNYEEYIAGTDLADTESVLALQGDVSTTGQIRLRWPGAAGRRYRIDQRPGFGDVFAPVVSNLTAVVDGPMATLLSLPSPAGQLRLRVEFPNP